MGSVFITHKMNIYLSYEDTANNKNKTDLPLIL